jgi:hypothetical protein
VSTAMLSRFLKKIIWLAYGDAVQTCSFLLLMYVPIVFAGQAKLANEKDMLAGQVKKLMRDVAKVIDIMMTYVPLYF